MSYAVLPLSDWQNILDSVRAKTGKSDKLVSGEVASEINGIVGDSGRRAMMAAIQNYGERCEYPYAFRNWRSDIFYPVYDIKPRYSPTQAGDTVTATQMFLGMHGSEPFDLAQRLEECGVKLDTSECNVFSYAFQSSNIMRVPEIDTRNMPSVVSIFNSAYELVTIDNLILKDDGSQDCTLLFGYIKKLANIKITGVFGKDVNLQWTTVLSRASIESVINALSATATGQTLTLSKTAVNAAFGSTATADWQALKASKSNWTISLV